MMASGFYFISEYDLDMNYAGFYFILEYDFDMHGRWAPPQYFFNLILIMIIELLILNQITVMLAPGFTPSVNVIWTGQ